MYNVKIRRHFSTRNTFFETQKKKKYHLKSIIFLSKNERFTVGCGWEGEFDRRGSYGLKQGIFSQRKEENHT